MTNPPNWLCRLGIHDWPKWSEASNSPTLLAKPDGTTEQVYIKSQERICTACGLRKARRAQ